MRACIQRVSRASVAVAGEIIGNIDVGMLVLLGVEVEDTEDDAAYLVDRVVGLRMFNDEEGRMNRDLDAVNGAVLVVSQFTLVGDCRKGRRPSFIRAAQPEQGNQLYQRFVASLQSRNVSVQTGRFGAMMEVSLVNDGPVTLLIDSRKRF